VVFMGPVCLMDRGDVNGSTLVLLLFPSRVVHMLADFVCNTAGKCQCRYDQA